MKRADPLGGGDRGAWCVVRGAWSVVRGAWCVVRGAWCVVRGAWCVVRGLEIPKTARKISWILRLSAHSKVSLDGSGIIEQGLNGDGRSLSYLFLIFLRTWIVV